MPRQSRRVPSPLDLVRKAVKELRAALDQLDQNSEDGLSEEYVVLSNIVDSLVDFEYLVGGD